MTSLCNVPRPANIRLIAPARYFAGVRGQRSTTIACVVMSPHPRTSLRLTLLLAQGSCKTAIILPYIRGAGELARYFQCAYHSDLGRMDGHSLNGLLIRSRGVRMTPSPSRMSADTPDSFVGLEGKNTHYIPSRVPAHNKQNSPPKVAITP